MAGLKQASAIHRFLHPFVNTNLELWESDGVPTQNGAKKGALCVDSTNGVLYINTGTKSSATWKRHNPSSTAAAVVAVASGTFTTAGGDAAETITASGVVATDVVAVTVKTAGGTPRSIVAAAAGTGSIAVTMSGDPSTDHVLQYVAFRAV